MSAQVTLHHVPPSFYSQIARLVLVEKGVGYRAQLSIAGPPLFETYAPAYISRNPNGTVPMLVDRREGERVVADSREILSHVDARFSGPELTPSDNGEREQMRGLVARLYGISFRILTYGDAKNLKLGARVNTLRLANLNRRRRRHPELEALYTAKLRDVELMMREAGDASLVIEERESVVRALDELDATLDDGREFLVGCRYSLADIVWTVGLARMHMLGVEPLDGRPALGAWYQRMRARPSFAGADVWERFDRRALAAVAVRKLGLPAVGVFALAGVIGYLLWSLV